MRIAMPVAEGKLSMHFGHCEVFAVAEVDEQTKEVKNVEMLTPPAHAPGVYPKWLSGIGVNVVLAGGMGVRAQQLFQQNGIEVVVGAPVVEPEAAAKMYAEGTLQCGENVCDH